MTHYKNAFPLRVLSSPVLSWINSSLLNLIDMNMQIQGSIFCLYVRWNAFNVPVLMSMEGKGINEDRPLNVHLCKCHETGRHPAIFCAKNSRAYFKSDWNSINTGLRNSRFFFKHLFLSWSMYAVKIVQKFSSRYVILNLKNGKFMARTQWKIQLCVQDVLSIAGGYRTDWK